MIARCGFCNEPIACACFGFGFCWACVDHARECEYVAFGTDVWEPDELEEAIAWELIKPG